MKINFQNPKQMMSHIALLSGQEAVDKLISTEAFKKDGTVIATVQFNGVEVPGEVIEKAMQDMYEGAERQIMERYAGAEAEVERRVKMRINDMVGKLYGAIDEDFNYDN